MEMESEYCCICGALVTDKAGNGSPENYLECSIQYKLGPKVYATLQISQAFCPGCSEVAKDLALTYMEGLANIGQVLKE